MRKTLQREIILPQTKPESEWLRGRYERIGDATDEELEAPLIPPTIAVEIRSPGDSRRDLADKVAVLVRAGTDVAIVVNPKTRTVFAQDATSRRIFWRDETFEHPALPGFTFSLAEMFDALKLRRPR